MFSYCGRLPDRILVCKARCRLIFNKLACALIVCMVFAANAHAQQRVVLTLAEAEDLALKHEPGQAAFLARASALDEQAVAAGQLPDPTLRIGLINYPINGGNFTTEGMTQAQLGFRQVFPRGKSRAASTKRLRSMAAAQSENAEARLRDVLTGARVAWLETYFWQHAHAVLSESRPFFEDLVSITQSMYAVGRKSQYDVLHAELELSRLDDRLIEADRYRGVAQASLSQWLSSDAYRPVADKLPTWEQVPVLADLQQNLSTHPLLLAADADISAQQSGVDLANENKKPGWVLDLGYGYRDGYLADGTPRSDFISLSVSVDLPLFKKNRQDRRLSAALSERSAAVAMKGQLHAQLRSELNSEYTRWTDLTRRMVLYETKILQLSENQAEAALLAYQSDAGDFSDVMRAQVDNLDTRLEHIGLQIERAQSYAVIANLGGLAR